MFQLLMENILLINGFVAQLDRAPVFETGCREFESLRAHQIMLY